MTAKPYRRPDVQPASNEPLDDELKLSDLFFGAAVPTVILLAMLAGYLIGATWGWWI